MATAKPMNRSRNQLATAYAPESFFTFEGGVGACISRSMAGEAAALAGHTRATIFERLEQFGAAWLESGMKARDNAKPDTQQKAPILPEQCVERHLLDEARASFRLPGADKFYFSKPSHMGFSPAPLTFVCRFCNLFYEAPSLANLSRDLSQLRDCKCQKSPSGKCSWEQLDVIFVHWSGNWAQASPHQYDFRAGSAMPVRSACLSCGSEEYRLNRDSPRIGEWHFYCANPRCNRALDRWMQRDRDTLEMFRVKRGEGRLSGTTEVNMEAIPYRASNAYHVQADLFIDFRDDSGAFSGLLRPNAEEQLRDFIARSYGFESTPLTDSDVERACEGKSECAADLKRFREATTGLEAARKVMGSVPPEARSSWDAILQPMLNSREQVIQSLRERRILLPKIELPGSVISDIAARRSKFAPRFDPYQLATEHAMLKENCLNLNETAGGARKYVSFCHLDADLSPESETDARDLERLATERFQTLGISDMGLIRQFDLCRFSFGYSRIKSAPVLHDKRFMDMPVRLRLFPMVRNDSSMKYPIYVVQQQNQAIYVRLDEQRVDAWLNSLGCADMFRLAAGQRIGAGLLQVTQPMDRFLEALPRTDMPPVYLYLYTLLHSYSHLVMKQVSEYSGLDMGSLGEYIFPADLAFVVYRNGTTMDLGNLSAMWRNSGPALLNSLLDLRSTQCGTGSLCTTRGAACPDCLMIPETSCIASNKLLSRSVLRSIGGRASFDTRQGAISGYLNFDGSQ